MGISTSAVACAELLAAVYRKASETRVKKSLFESVVSAFEQDWSSVIIVEANDRLNEMIHKVIANHGLRSFDAIHLASALTIGTAVADNFLFACYDERLRQAALAEGPETLSSSAAGRGN